jgi:hypothetical protein
MNIDVDKSKLYGLMGSTLSSIVLLLCLWFVVLAVPKSTENEGFQVSFGDSFDAGGVGDGVPTITPSQIPNQVVVQKIAEVPVRQSADTKVFTQTENSVAIAEKKEMERKNKEQQELINQQNEKNKRLADQKQKEQDARNKADNLIGGTFGGNNVPGNGKSGGDGTGNGYGSGSNAGIQGSSVGKGNFANIKGRMAILVVEPVEIFQEGRAIVSIRVNAAGIVISAKCKSGDISDYRTIKMVENAAYATKFSKGNGEAVGVITYELKYK